MATCGRGGLSILNRFQNHLPAIESFGPAGGRDTFDSPDPMHRLESVAGKPVSGRLGLKVLHQQFDFTCTELLRDWHEHIGLAKVAIVLKYFVFKNQMISERVPSQVRQDPMVLMAVIAVMGEDNIRIEFRLNFLKPFLDGRPLAREITLAKRSNLDL